MQHSLVRLTAYISENVEKVDQRANKPCEVTKLDLDKIRDQITRSVQNQIVFSQKLAELYTLKEANILPELKMTLSKSVLDATHLPRPDLIKIDFANLKQEKRPESLEKSQRKYAE